MMRKPPQQRNSSLRIQTNAPTTANSHSAFILPSFSEGLPMSVLEAWAY